MVHGRTLALAAALSVWLGAAPTRAQDEPSGGPDYSRAGYYAAVGGSFTLDSQGYRQSTDAYGFAVRVGRRFSNIVAAEVQLERIDETCVRQCGFRGRQNVDFTAWTITANLRGYPNWAGEQISFVDGRVQPFVLMGMGALVVDPTLQGTSTTRQPNDLLAQNTRFALRLGAGVELHATENLAVVLDATWLGGIRTGKRGREPGLPLFTDIQYGGFILAVQYRY